jgi:ABC-type nickel/cobalt efflux system permease component RcnA
LIALYGRILVIFGGLLMKVENTKKKVDKKTNTEKTTNKQTNNKQTNKQQTNNICKCCENGGAGDQSKNGSKITDVLKKSVEVSGPLKTMGTALHTGLNLPNATLETLV